MSVYPGVKQDPSDAPLFSLVVPWQHNLLVHLGSSAEDGRAQWAAAGGKTRYFRLNLAEAPGLTVHMGVGGTRRNARAEKVFEAITGSVLMMTGPVVFHGLSITQIQRYMGSMFEELHGPEGLGQ